MSETKFDVIIVGGSFAGLSAAMALGRSLRNVLVIDSGKPCNRQTPHAHNLITHDGKNPAEISAEAKRQVMAYPTVTFLNELAVSLSGQDQAFSVGTQSGKTYQCSKILLATGVRDVMPDIEGFAECWGVTALHCPYCHGYEVSNRPLGVLAYGEVGYHMGMLIHHWSRDLCLFTNGPSTLTDLQTQKLVSKGICIIEKEISSFDHIHGKLRSLVLADGSTHSLEAIFAKIPFSQHSEIPALSGCELTEDGYVKVDELKRTSVAGIFAAGDNTSAGRSLSVAIAAGTMAGASANAELIRESF